MAKNNKKISSIIKSSVLLELSAEGYSISKIAQTHGISRGVIYSWIKELEVSGTREVSDMNPVSRNNFIEVALLDNKASSKLQKASLVFNDFSLSIEGKITSASLIEIVKILEPQSC